MSLTITWGISGFQKHEAHSLWSTFGTPWLPEWRKVKELTL